MLLLAQDEEGDGGRMTDEQLRDEAMTIFLAGHETTANALTWTWYLLSQNPDAEAKLHAELDEVLGDACLRSKMSRACATRKWCSPNRCVFIRRPGPLGEWR